ncbi:MAG: hypothetical protein GYA17_15680 [Chloroflexi bacterium]|jgi:hypothetical protein|nr:hypothetical protein [Chloroflexota bacterium]
MSAIVKLGEIIDAMESASDMVDFYLDRRTGEVIMITQDMQVDMEMGEDLDASLDWTHEQAQQYLEIKDTENCLRLPDQFEIHEYSIMEDFIETIEDYRLHTALSDAIRGQGAFRRFKNLIYTKGIEQSWFDFRARAFREMAIQWLESHNLAYTEA